MIDFDAPANDNHGKQQARDEIDWLLIVAIPVAIGYWITVAVALWQTLQWIGRMVGLG